MATKTPPPPKKSKLRRYLIARHGETNFNKERRVQGTLDTACVLTLDGISQAAALGVYVARRQAGEAPDDADDHDGGGDANNNTTDKKLSPSSAPAIARTWCSPLTRCRQTYAAISGCCCSSSSKVPPLPNPLIHNDLREIEFLHWQGRLRKEIIEQDSENWNVFKSDPKMLRLNNNDKDGTSFAPVVDCWERGMKCWNDIRSRAAVDAADAIFIMCHGAIGQCMLLQALGLDIEMYGKSRRYSFDNCECIEFEWADDEDDKKETCAIRWRRVHPVGSKWQFTSASRAMAMGGLSCSR
ncbi:hypothetical protein ACHAXR_003495 [Thalassiosira sp. AJA248-18]